MPKKTATARSGAQRNRPKVQKSVELVRKVSNVPDKKEIELSEVDVEETNSSGVSVAVDQASPVTRKRERASNGSSRKSAESVSNGESVVREESITPASSGADTSTSSIPAAPPKGSAAARLAARRQAAHKSQQRAAASMITAEHYSYVVKDLRIIAILAAIMLVGIIILYFVPGIGS